MYLQQKRVLLVLGVLVPLFFVFYAYVTYAATDTHTTVASPIILPSSVNSGDIISYVAKDASYTPSQVKADEEMFGVVVDDPVLYLESNIANKDGARPVVRYGEAIVNVSTLEGMIYPGDLVTTSRLPGIGQRGVPGKVIYALGFAIEPMMISDTPAVQVGDKEVRFGTVSVALRIGPQLTEEGVDFIATGGTESTSKSSANASVSDGALSALKVFKYILAAVVAVTAMVVSMRRFGDSFTQSVISVGRNPLARKEIRSILFWNALLIVLVSGVGLGIAAAIILFP